ncbi:MAG: efflux RND transporter periplasmic adaptor subunit [Betaproteobacteria bacterium]
MKARTLIAALVLLALGGAAGYYAARHAHAPTPSATPTAGGEPAASGERKILYWHDPMVPGPRFDKPGRSPFMDMDLVPKYADEGGEDGTVSISPRVAQNLGVRTAVAQPGRLDARVAVVGRVEYNDRSTVVVAPRANAFVEKVLVRAVQDPVRRGQPLVELLVPDWASAQEEYLALRASKVPGAEALASAARERLLLAGMSEAQVRALESSGRVQARLTLVSPIDGVVAELGVREGMTVPMGTMLYRLVTLDSVWVEAEVPEAQAALVRTGQSVDVTVPAWPGEVFRGRVAAVLPEVNAETRTLRARIELANPGARLRPGRYATVAVADPTGTKEPVLLVPAEAVIRTGTRALVLVAEGEGKFRQAEVSLGRESRGQIEVLKGLAPGAQVVVSGQFLVDSEANLRATGARLDNAGSGAPRHTGEGVVERVAGSDITISHGPVASARMGAMTMAFKAPKDANAAPKVGERIRFEFAIEPSGDFQIYRIEPLGAGQSTVPAPRLNPAPGAAAPAAPAPAAAATVAAPAGASVRSAAAPAATPSAVHRAEGSIVSADAHSLLIKHGPVPSAGMGAMTMEFLAPKTLPPGLKAGDRVRFEFTASPEGEYRAVKVEKLGATP